MLPKGNVMIMICDLNNKLTFDHRFLRHGLDDRKNNGELCADFCHFNRTVIDATLFEHKAWQKIS